MESSFFVKQDTPLTHLFKILIKAYPNFEKLEKEKLHERLFSKETFNTKKITDLFSDLTLLLEEFLAIEYIRKNKSQLHSIKSMTYYNRGDFYNFNRHADKALMTWTDQDNIYGAHEKLLLCQHIHYYPYAEKSNQHKMSLTKVNELTDEVYILSKLRYFCEIQTGKTIYAQKIESTFSDEIFLMAKQIRHKYPLIDFYLDLIYLYKSDAMEAEFVKVRDSFYRLFKLLNPFEASIIITILSNFCGLQYYLKKEPYLVYKYELYKFGLSHQLYSLYGYLKHTTFMNIVITAAGVEDYDFIEVFLRLNSQKLKVLYRSKCKQLGQAYKHFAKGEYFEANQKVIFLEEKSIFFSLRARFLALRCNFEFLIEDDNQRVPFLAHCQNFKKFIKKQDKLLALSNRTTYLKHISILEDIAAFINKGRITQVQGEIFLERIHNTSSLVGWQNLQKKVQQLMQKK